MALPIFGRIEYRTVEGYIVFPLNAKTKFRSAPEKDSTGRTIKWTKCTLTVECYISAGDIFSDASTVDGDFALMRKVLESPGGVLKIDNKGFGNLNYNASNGQTTQFGDIAWGPFPTVVEASPIGSVTCFVVWQLEFCYLNSYHAAKMGIVEFSWTAKFDLNEDGATTRTISGHLLVAGRRLVALGTPDISVSQIHPFSNADDYRENIRIECPAGFVRDRQTYDVNDAKNRIDFSIVDRQLPHEAYPSGITDMDCGFELDTSSEKGGIFTRFIWSFSGSAKAALSYPKSIALKALREEHDFRFIQLLAQLKSSHGTIIPLPARFRVQEKTKGQDARRVHLSIAWILTVLPVNGQFFPKDILIRTGFFKQNNKNSNDRWNSDMRRPGGPLTHRGHAQLVVNSNEDRITDLRTRDLPVIGWGRKNFIQLGSAPDTFPFLPPNGAYHDYSNTLEAHTITGTVIPVPISGADDTIKVFQRIDVDRTRFKMYGYAIRYGKRPEVPRLAKVNGVEAYQIGLPVTKQEDLKNLNGVAIYRAQWEIWYELKQDKKNNNSSQMAIENPANPAGSGTSVQNIILPPTVVGE